MPPSELFGIAILAIALVAVIAVPGEPRWLRRPGFIRGSPRRAPIAAFIAVLLVATIARADALLLRAFSSGLKAEGSAGRLQKLWSRPLRISLLTRVPF
jgi:hypothetical protein